MFQASSARVFNGDRRRIDAANGAQTTETTGQASCSTPCVQHLQRSPSRGRTHAAYDVLLSADEPPMAIFGGTKAMVLSLLHVQEATPKGGELSTSVGSFP